MVPTTLRQRLTATSMLVASLFLSGCCCCDPCCVLIDPCLDPCAPCCDPCYDICCEPVVMPMICPPVRHPRPPRHYPRRPNWLTRSTFDPGCRTRPAPAPVPVRHRFRRARCVEDHCIEQKWSGEAACVDVPACVAPAQCAAPVDCAVPAACAAPIMNPDLCVANWESHEYVDHSIELDDSSNADWTPRNNEDSQQMNPGKTSIKAPKSPKPQKLPQEKTSKVAAPQSASAQPNLFPTEEPKAKRVIKANPDPKPKAPKKIPTERGASFSPPLVPPAR